MLSRPMRARLNRAELDMPPADRKRIAVQPTARRC
jgi:hypothetical protein